ncbi:hypothetical protein [Microbacterium mangrovi]|nr:hypothetical protein [Microbacterium mangrovi]
MSATEHADQTEPAAAPPLQAPPLPSPLSMIADGATCSLDGTCTPL